MPGVVFAKRQLPFNLVSLGKGFEVRFSGVVGGGFPKGNEGKWEGGGEGISNLPFSFSPIVFKHFISWLFSWIPWFFTAPRTTGSCSISRGVVFEFPSRVVIFLSLTEPPLPDPTPSPPNTPRLAPKRIGPKWIELDICKLFGVGIGGLSGGGAGCQGKRKSLISCEKRTIPFLNNPIPALRKVTSNSRPG